jgi:lysozyme family protein
MNKEQIIDLIILDEGSVYTNYSEDAGGPTKYGITIPAFSDFLGRSVTAEDISHLNRETAELFYSNWYDKYKIDSYPAVFRHPFVDTIVNNGYGGASGLLQKSLVFLGQPIKVDYDAGPATRAAVKNVDADLLKEVFLNEREAKVRRIVDNDSSQEIFLQGWLNRINRLRAST